MDASDLVSLEQIKQLKARYFRLLDTRQWGEWGQVFTREARLQWGPRDADAAVGRDAIVAAVSRALEGATSCHHGHMPEIEILGPGRARGIWAMSDRVEAPRFRLEGYGHYEEEYRVEDGAWRIHRSRLTRLHVERGQR